MDRVAAITTPNGNQAALADINIANGGNLLRNAGAETANPLDSSGLTAQFWTTDSVGSTGARDSSQSHSGSYSLKAALTPSLYGTAQYGSPAYGAAQSFIQNALALPPGGRYLANVWTEKSNDGNPATVA